MRLKGVDCRRAGHLGFRDAEPGRDVDLDGEPHERGYAVFVRMKDCQIYESEDGRILYDPSEAPAIPAVNGATWYAYGQTRHHEKFVRLRERDGTERDVFEYWTTPFYAVRDAKVYHGTIHHYDSPPPAYERERGANARTQTVGP